MGIMNKILLIEDDQSINKILAYELSKKGYQVDSLFDGKEAVQTILENDYDLVLVDWMLPYQNGVSIIKEVRSNDYVKPLILLTARSEQEDIIKGLEAGADDYITKPFSVEELLARIRVAQRRLSVNQGIDGKESAVFTNGELKIDYTAGCVFLRGEELHLTPIEYKLLCLLSRNMGKVLTHTYITQQVWGRSSENDVASLRVFMATLRKKLEADKKEVQYIQTHIGIGYRMLKIE